MDKKDEIIRRGIRSLTHRPHEVISGTVIAGSLDTELYTISVQPSGDSQPIAGVMLGITTNDNSRMIQIPADGCNVIIASIDGPGEWTLIKAADITRILMVIGSSTLSIAEGLIQFNDGSNGGLCITPTLKTELDKTNQTLQHIVSIISGTVVDEPGSGAPSALQAALSAAIAHDTLGDFSSIEDTTVKH